MLYVKFTVKDESKYQDFQKVYDHMVMTRQPGFEFQEDGGPEFDWNSMTKEAADKAMEELNAFLNVSDEERRYLQLIPTYAQKYLSSYVEEDEKSAGVFGYQISGIFNYLEYSMEVDMNNLQIIKENMGVVEFSALAYPYGGMERFLMVLKAFDLIPIECFNGFNVCTFEWTSEFTYEIIEMPEATKEYKEKGTLFFK